jgi:hypothetical protein
MTILLVTGASVPLQGPLLPNKFLVEGASDRGDAPTAVQVSVTPEFFPTVGTPLVRGRMIQDTDTKHPHGLSWSMKRRRVISGVTVILLDVESASLRTSSSTACRSPHPG